MQEILSAVQVVSGAGSGALLWSDVGLSFWGGVDPLTGVVIDHTHPLFGECIDGKVLAIPNGRGSCTGSQVMLELILNGLAPAAILLRQPDSILALGSIVGDEMFSKSIPIASVGAEGFQRIKHYAQVTVDGSTVVAGASADEVASSVVAAVAARPTESPAGPSSALQLTEEEQGMMDGSRGEAAAVAMRILARAGDIDGAPSLIEISQAHIDGCTYIGPGGLRFAERLVELGGRVSVPTTLNATSVDRRRWRQLGVPAALGKPAEALGSAYLAMGCSDRSFTCAPYLLQSAPARGEQVAWGESNAVVFANSVLGARTQKYADYLDICAAITGRVPRAGAHLDAHRKATAVLDATALVKDLADTLGDAFFPALGYLCGLSSEAHVPLVVGLKGRRVSLDDLKAFSAAFGSTASVPLFHMEGVTPEAPDAAAALSQVAGDVEVVALTAAGLADAWARLDSCNRSAAVSTAGHAGGSQDNVVDLVALGNPHFSLTECAALAELCASSPPKHPHVSLVVTLGREALAQAQAAGHLAPLEAFGASFISDTCWCMLTEPVVPPSSAALATNSAKFAHYAPGLVGRRVHFTSLAGCVRAAATGRAAAAPAWVAPWVASPRRGAHELAHEAKPSAPLAPLARAFSTSRVASRVAVGGVRALLRLG